MTPNTRLLWLVGLVVIPAATCVTVWPELAAPALLIAFAVLAVALVDAACCFDVLRDIRVSVPDLVRGTKGRRMEIAIKVFDSSARRKRLTVGLRFPRELRPATPLLTKVLPGSAQNSIMQWDVLALKRGSFRFDCIYLETPSFLGLWVRRSSREIAMEFRVYPNLARERRGLASLFLNRGGLGTHARPQLGKGREFEKLREYVPGDDYSDIYWKGTARRAFPTTKTFQIERTQEIYVVIDHSRLSSREVRLAIDDKDEDYGIGSDSMAAGGEFEITTQLERFLQAALSLGLVAQRQADLFGVVTFANQVTRFIRSNNGRGHYDSCRDALFTLQPELVSPNFEELVIFLRKSLTHRALLLIFTDLTDPLIAEHFQETLPLITRQHLVLVNMVKPLDVGPLFRSSLPVKSLDDIYSALGKHFVWSDLEEIGTKLKHLGVQFTMPESDQLTVDAVSQYMNVKRRQLL